MKKVIKAVYKKVRTVWENLILSLNILKYEAIKIEHKTDIFNNKQNIFVCLKGKNDIPIVQLEKPLKLNELEEKAIEIASFLKVPVKGI